MARCLVCLVLLSATAMAIMGCDNSSTGGNTPPKQFLNTTPNAAGGGK